MVALMDPGYLLQLSMCGLPSLAQPFPCPACALGREKLQSFMVVSALGLPRGSLSPEVSPSGWM